MGVQSELTERRGKLRVPLELEVIDRSMIFENVVVCDGVIA